MFTWQVHQQFMLMVLHEQLVESYVAAQGNIFNHADGIDDIYVAPSKGRVYIYQSPQDPRIKKGETSIMSEVTPQLKPILKTLARRFSPVSSKSFLDTYTAKK